MTFTLRPAKSTDANGLTRIIDAAYAGYAARGIELPPVSEGVDEDIAENTVLIAENAGTVLGGAILMLQCEKAKLANLAVHPDHGGRGIGGALMHAAVQAAREAGHATLHLTTHVDMLENVALYRHLGWTMTSTEGNKVLMMFNLHPDPNGDTT